MYLLQGFLEIRTAEFVCLLRVVPGTDTISSEEFAAKIEELGLSGYSRIEFVVADPATVYDLDIAKFSHSHFPDLQCPLI